MSYTVLARKWRPKSFAELVGQSHVMQALSNALDQQRLHHAYLFTGTRGVGKTTIARIFAKALNCQQGISSTPCGVCDTCRSIDEGRFIDLIEVDAASKTKVDDTREILDNVQFAPTQGRYKVYLIDEVHMLSKSSFNALLKTLEEPPEHVKFLLATTDPHKLPITVLSRCLQFNLMRLTQLQMQNHLANILQQEGINYEEAALALIAKSADGSARDSLSILDQSIAYGAGEVMFEPVQTMLGLVDQQFGVAILKALADSDAQQVKAVIQQLATMGVDYQALLSQLIESLHAISYMQVFNDSETTTLLPNDIVQNFAQVLSPEKVQLLYQIALLTKQDMSLAPDVRIGFEMALMRMLAFQPASSPVVAEDSKRSNGASTSASNMSANISANTMANSESAPMSAQEALSSLASARSLVGKKNSNSSVVTTEKSLEPASPVQPTIAEQTPGYDGSAMASKNVAQEGLGQTVENIVEQAAEPKFELSSEPSIDPSFMQNVPGQEPTHSEHSYQKQESFSQQNTMGSPVQQPEPQQEQNVAPTTDHLSQIRERLKQPLGKSKAQPGVAFESEVKPVEAPGNETNSMSAVDAVAKMAQTNAQVDVSSPSIVAENDFIQNQQSASIAADFNNEAPPWNLASSEQTQGQFSVGSVNSERDHSHSTVNVDMVADNSIPNAVQENAMAVDSFTSEDQPEPVDAQTVLQALTGDVLPDWLALIEKLALNGMAAEIARNSVLVGCNENRLVISIDPEQQYAKSESAIRQIELAAKVIFGNDFVLELGQAAEYFTPAKYAQQLAADKQSQAIQSIEQDSVVQSLVNTLGMQVINSSIKPI